MMRSALTVVGLVCSALWWAFALPTASPPHVLLILTDDQGYGDVGLHGNALIETPAIDQLAKESAQFERFFVSPLCAPTRASLLTGRYHLRTGTVSVSKGMEVMKSEETTLAELFKANGYQTGIFGKWHNGAHGTNHPNEQGFDEFFGFCGGHWSNYFDTHLEHNGKSVATKGFITDVLTDQALRFMERHRAASFFCYVPLNAPHSPHQVPDRYFDKYKAKGLNDELASIYGMCENVDDNVGRLLAKLQDLGLEENTIVIFMTDNGPNGKRFNGNMKGIKGSVDEGGVRVPCFVRWKGSIKPSTVHVQGAHIDILPTLRELCQLRVVSTLPLDGINLTTHLLGAPNTQPDRKIYSHVAQPELPLKSYPGGIRTNQYRLVVKERTTELFDMNTDPSQQRDIAALQPAITKQLHEDYQRWFDETSRGINPQLTISLGAKHTRTELPVYEATFGGNLRFKEGHGWAHDWLTNWLSPKDTIIWEVESPRPERVKIAMNYTCPTASLGATVRVVVGSQSVSRRITRAFDPPVRPSPDRVPRKEAYEKPWTQLLIGSVVLPKGKSKIILTAPQVARLSVAEVKSIILTKY